MNNPNVLERKFEEGWPSSLPRGRREAETDGQNRLSVGRHTIADGVSEPRLVPDCLSKGQNDGTSTEMDAVPSGLVLGGRGGEGATRIDGGLGNDPAAESEALSACEGHAGGLFQEMQKVFMDNIFQRIKMSYGKMLRIKIILCGNLY